MLGWSLTLLSIACVCRVICHIHVHDLIGSHTVSGLYSVLILIPRFTKGVAVTFLRRLPLLGA
jgi:hypothetical protein